MVADYDTKVLHNIIKHTELNKTLVNAFEFIPVALNYGSVKTTIIEQIKKDGTLSDENNKLFETTTTDFNKKASTFIECINKNICKFENNEKNVR
jgi:hypothetical protein